MARGAKWLWVDSRTRAIAFLIAATLMVGVVVCIGFASVWRLYGWLPEGALNSDRLRLSHAIATTWLDEAPDIVLVGGSQVREILPADEFVSAELSASCGRPVRVLNAATSGQLLQTSWAVIDHFAQRSRPVVVVNANFLRMSENVENPSRLGRSMVLLPTPADPPPELGTLQMSPMDQINLRLGIVFSDAVHAAGLRQVHERVAVDPFDARQHAYRAPGWTTGRKAMDAHFQLTLAEESADAITANMRSYQALAEELQRRGLRIGFLVTPEAPEYVMVWQQTREQLASAVETLARQSEMLDLHDAALDSGDFFDTVHLLSSGRRKIWPRMKSYLLAQLPDCPLPRDPV